MPELIEVKTSTLGGELLNWAMAQAEGVAVQLQRGGRYGEPDSLWFVAHGLGGARMNWAGNWGLTGPLQVKYLLEVGFDGAEGGIWYFTCARDDTDILELAPHDKYLTGLCRAVVALKLGDTVLVPSELVAP